MIRMTVNTPSQKSSPQPLCAVVAGDVFRDCRVIDQNELYFFLEHPEGNTYYDIVMPKYDLDNNDIHLDLNLNINDIVTVRVHGINIADDGRPGAFVILQI